MQRWHCNLLPTQYLPFVACRGGMRMIAYRRLPHPRVSEERRLNHLARIPALLEWRTSNTDEPCSAVERWGECSREVGRVQCSIVRTSHCIVHSSLRDCVCRTACLDHAFRVHESALQTRPRLSESVRFEEPVLLSRPLRSTCVYMVGRVWSRLVKVR